MHMYISPAFDGSKFRKYNDVTMQLSWSSKRETLDSPENLNQNGSKPDPRTQSSRFIDCIKTGFKNRSLS